MPRRAAAGRGSPAGRPDTRARGAVAGASPWLATISPRLCGAMDRAHGSRVPAANAAHRARPADRCSLFRRCRLPGPALRELSSRASWVEAFAAPDCPVRPGGCDVCANGTAAPAAMREIRIQRLPATRRMHSRHRVRGDKSCNPERFVGAQRRANRVLQRAIAGPVSTIVFRCDRERGRRQRCDGSMGMRTDRAVSQPYRGTVGRDVASGAQAHPGPSSDPAAHPCPASLVSNPRRSRIAAGSGQKSVPPPPAQQS